jgi:hypothetical protein
MTFLFTIFYLQHVINRDVVATAGPGPVSAPASADN